MSDGLKSGASGRFPVGLTIATVVALVILVGLGTWQLQRLGWKQALLADYARTEVVPPVAIEALLNRPENVAWRQAVLRDCEISPERIVYLHGVADAEAGYHLLTPCPVADGYILTDIGFLREKSSETAPVTVSGVLGRLRPFETPNSFMPPNNPAADDWYQRRVEDLSARWGVTLRDDYYLALSEGNVLGAKPVDLTRNLTNRHLEYALTWYALGLTLVAIYVAVIRRRLRAAPKEKV
ncbi:SURF1 family protein [Asticcacaulis tiandongensis]|uniref:SURF1 family protein n=1 Tax=Asticcacaulis tiandongensis TaxID=2565365 RepID=UPI00112DD678|nr:SURF1 family cytochrome oxidase biogenesis protein [Asticcacaulis tiandongensis]